MEEIFAFETEKETDVITSVIKSTKLKPFTVKLKDGEDSFCEVSCLSSQDNVTSILALAEKNNMNISPCKSTNVEEMYEKKNLPDDYMFQRVYLNKFRGIPKYENYSEIDDETLSLLNNDWCLDTALRLICCKLLSGCILVNGKQILLVNCCEIYGRLPTADNHHERFLGDGSSLPTIKDRYKKIKVCNLLNDNSKKLIIGTFTFNILVTSSVRIDEETFLPELGSTTSNFIANEQTKVYLANSSRIEAKSILEKKKTLFEPFDIMSQLRQLRSKFSYSSTYAISRSCSTFVNDLTCRPYTIFTVADADGLNPETDTKLGSKIMQIIALAVITKEGLLNKEEIERITPKKKKTQMCNCIDRILSLFSNQEEISIINNQELGSILSEIENV